MKKLDELLLLKTDEEVKLVEKTLSSNKVEKWDC